MQEEKRYSLITAEKLKQKASEQAPDNDSSTEGYALINVLSPESFAVRHIPGSINIPRGQEDQIEGKFDKAKEIIVYCSSPTCNASPAVASELVRRGFTNIIDYEGGLSDWIDAGYPIEGEAADQS